ncbi:hypothetical protein AVEN_151993-1, partial [Araneus ventricosus]
LQDFVLFKPGKFRYFDTKSSDPFELHLGHSISGRGMAATIPAGSPRCGINCRGISGTGTQRQL